MKENTIMPMVVVQLHAARKGKTGKMHVKDIYQNIVKTGSSVSYVDFLRMMNNNRDKFDACEGEIGLTAHLIGLSS